jgi:hypothetical protein
VPNYASRRFTSVSGYRYYIRLSNWLSLVWVVCCFAF